MSRIDCDDFRTFIDPYLDGEFDPAERATFDAHLTICGECRRYFEQRAWMQKALKPALKRPCAMPMAARDRVCRALRVAERPARIRRAAKRMAPLSTLAAVGAIFLFVTPLTGFKPVVDEAVAQHMQPWPVEMPTNEVTEVTHWFQDKVPFSVAAPRFVDRRVTLLGARLSRVGRNTGDRSRPAAYLMYQVGGHKMTVLVFDGADLGLTEQVAQKAPEVHEQADLRVALFQHGALAYAVTSDLPADEMIALLRPTF
ncbi:MAG: zf-HC2 domain-containing protein [Myxococcales bacterium]|nr:zf-HC2 domain-containing protein [Myxococcales bacterium]